MRKSRQILLRRHKISFSEFKLFGERRSQVHATSATRTGAGVCSNMHRLGHKHAQMFGIRRPRRNWEAGWHPSHCAPPSSQTILPRSCRTIKSDHFFQPSSQTIFSDHLATILWDLTRHFMISPLPCCIILPGFDSCDCPPVEIP